jgi:hypothetical protein
MKELLLNDCAEKDVMGTLSCNDMGKGTDAVYHSVFYMCP